MQPKRPEIPWRHRPRGLVILYEDRDVLVVDKEPGLLTMSRHRDEARTVERILSRYVGKGNPRSRQRVYVVHRLDRETSGLLVLTKSSAAQLRLKATWEQTEKWYLAAVHGHLTSRAGVFSSYLAEDEDQFVRTVKDPRAGRMARTTYQVIKETRTMSLLKVGLLTGRKNQIRVHFAEAGHPVVGDPKYGRPGDPCKRMALHAKQLAFGHPHSGARMSFDAGIPEFFQRLAGGLSEADWAGSPPEK